MTVISIFELLLNIIPYVFIGINYYLASKAKTELTEIKHILYAILWGIFAIGDNLL